MTTVVEYPTSKNISNIKLPSGVQNGDKYTVKGTLKSDFTPDTGVSINIAKKKCPPFPKADIAFHFNPRINRQLVVRNAFNNGRWGAEERDIPSFPFTHSVEFTIVIDVHRDGYKVYVNGHTHPLCTFEHRLGYDFHYIHLTEGADWTHVTVEKNALHNCNNTPSHSLALVS